MISVIQDRLKTEITRPAMVGYAIPAFSAEILLMHAGTPAPELTGPNMLAWALSFWDCDPGHAPIYAEMTIGFNDTAHISFPVGKDVVGLTMFARLTSQKATPEFTRVPA